MGRFYDKIIIEIREWVRIEKSAIIHCALHCFMQNYRLNHCKGLLNSRKISKNQMLSYFQIKFKIFQDKPNFSIYDADRVL